MLKKFRFPGEPDNSFKFFSIVLIFYMGSIDKTSNVFRIVGNNQHNTFQVSPTICSHYFQVSLYFERHQVLKHKLFLGVLIMIKTTIPLLAQQFVHILSVMQVDLFDCIKYKSRKSL